MLVAGEVLGGVALVEVAGAVAGATLGGSTKPSEVELGEVAGGVACRGKVLRKTAKTAETQFAALINDFIYSLLLKCLHGAEPQTVLDLSAGGRGRHSDCCWNCPLNWRLYRASRG